MAQSRRVRPLDGRDSNACNEVPGRSRCEEAAESRESDKHEKDCEPFEVEEYCCNSQR